jgi:hypothetical protein
MKFAEFFVYLCHERVLKEGVLIAEEVSCI